jgi:hypothetical protein
MFCARGLIFGGTEGVVSRFSCFVLPDSFSAVPSASGPVFLFWAPELVNGGTDGVGSLFHVLRSRTRFRRYRVRRVLFHVLRAWTRFQLYRGRRVPFSCFARPDLFSAVPRASHHVFMFSAPGHVFGGTKGVGSNFHVLRSRTHFRRYRGRRVPFSRFAFPDSFSAVSGASGPVFMFSAPRHVFGGTKGVGSRFHVLRSRTHFWRYHGCRVLFSHFPVPDSFSAVSGRRVPFSCFACPDLLSAVPRASGPVFMFCSPGRILDGTEGVCSRFHVLRVRTLFLRY